MNTAAVVAGATALGIASCCWGSSAGPTCTAQVAAARRCEPEPEPEVLLSQPKSRRKPEPKQAGQYFDNDFPYSSVVEEGAAAVRQHGEFLPDTRCEELEAQAATRWDEFYRRHAAGFFKPRNYLLHCFPELAAGDGPTAQLNGVATSGSDSCPRTVLEVGCGAGDTAFTLLELNPTLNVLACDFSPAAVATTKASQLYAKHSASGRCKAFVWDLTHEHLPQEIAHLEGQLDVVVAVFVLSAIAPDKHADVADRLVRLLRPGSGVALFRDYGRYDLSQVRYKPGQRISENFYMRQDGTRTYYFTVDELSQLWSSCGCDVIECKMCTVINKNRKKKLDMKRVFAQGRFRRAAN